jgi:surfeit locus 1 family protein
VKKLFRPASLLQSVVALALIGLCLLAANWQWHKGQFRSHQNSIISSNQSAPALHQSALAGADPLKIQWRLAELSGAFDPAHQLLLKNRYSDGHYGFEVLTLFRTDVGDNFWVDRGWVAAGPAANIAPTVPKISSQQMSVVVRIRADDISRQIEGSYFALPGTKRPTVNLSATQGVTAAPYYVDLYSSSDSSVKSLTPITLPELSNGPHFAYALQWLAFAVLLVVGRILLFRESQ